MKVLHQIIAYLRRRGLLPREQLVELASQGILPWHEVYEERESEPKEEAVWEEPDEEPEPAGRPRPRPGRGPSPRGPVGGPRELGLRIAERFDACRSALDALVQLGRPAGLTTCQETAVAVRNIDLVRLAETLIDRIEARSLALPALWQALEVDPSDGILAGTD